MRLKRARAGAAAVGFLLVLTAGCSDNSGAEEAADSTLADLVSSGELRYGVIPEAAPGFIEEDGEWNGYCADIAEAIAEQLDLEPVPVRTTWGNMALDLQSDKLDMAVCAQPTGARALVVDYTTHPIYTNYYVLIAQDEVEVTHWSQLDADIRVGSEVGDSTIEPVHTYAPDLNVTSFNDRDQALLALQADQIDAKTDTLLNGLQVIAAREDLNAKVIVPEPLIAAPSAVMVQRRSDDSLLSAINTVVWNLNSSGVNRSIVLKYLEQSGIDLGDIPQNADL